ncbi:MAG: hypothetical protein D6714_08205 [Bacteroidetes bacterium]|nr:MAG: hypothetical protein D6714_08205 [Bacteroidota bacterium]
MPGFRPICPAFLSFPSTKEVRTFRGFYLLSGAWEHWVFWGKNVPVFFPGAGASGLSNGFFAGAGFV